MPKRNQRPRKRARSRSSASSEPACPPPAAAAAAEAAVRSIPGFVWDADKRRYFPAASRSAHSSAQRDESRETHRVQQVELIQKQRQQNDRSLSIDYPPALPLLLRRRSAGQWPTLGSDRLRFSSLDKSTPCVFSTNGQSSVSAVAIASDGQRAAIGRRDGSLWRAELASSSSTHSQSSSVALSGGPGEIVSIRRIADRFIAAYLGDEHSGGGMVAITGSSRLRYADCSVLTASGPPTCGLPHTAVGLSGRVSIAAISDAHMAEVFTAQTKTDIMSTTFAMDSPYVFVGGGRDGRVRLFDTRAASSQHDRKRGLLSSALVAKSSIHGVGTHGWRLVAASMDSGVRMWDVRMPDDKRQRKSFDASDCFGDLHQPLRILSATRLGFAVCQDFIAAAGSDNQVRVWSMRTGSTLQTIVLPPSAAACTAIDLALSPT
ncbi:hypothetical protein IWW47_000837, partial [Coemansia sp. RSA 2052]